MIIKVQNVLFPYARQREDRNQVQLTKKDRVNADRLVMILLLAGITAGAIIFSL